MFVIGLTGGIAMGKTTVARQFAACGAHVICADSIVHNLLAPGGKAVAQVAKAFPKAQEGKGISRKALGACVFNDPAALHTLEAILHPLVRAEEEHALQRLARKGVKLAVMDIPLLFETAAESRFDATVTVSAPQFLQKQRALVRAGMDDARLRAVIARQLADAKRKRKADFVIHTGLGKAYSFQQVKAIVRAVV